MIECWNCNHKLEDIGKTSDLYCIHCDMWYMQCGEEYNDYRDYISYRWLIFGRYLVDYAYSEYKHYTAIYTTSICDALEARTNDREYFTIKNDNNFIHWERLEKLVLLA